MDAFISLKMKTHLIFSAADVIPDWSAARGSGGKFACWTFQGVKSIWITADSEWWHFIYSLGEEPAELPLYLWVFKCFLSMWRRLNWEGKEPVSDKILHKASV